MNPLPVPASAQLANVRYEIRGPLAAKAQELENAGYDIIKLNIGNPGAFGFRVPDSMRRAVIQNLDASDAYCHQKGIFPAREAVVIQQQERGITDVDIEDVYIGNGVSELIMMTMRALLNQGDEVLVPAPDYPLWTAAVCIHGGKAVHYACPPENGFLPDPALVREQVTARTKALVIISPNNPSGAVYPRALLEELVQIAEDHHLIVLSDEIYDQMTYDDAVYTPVAPLVRHTLCATFSGLSKVYRACGFRVGWAVFSGYRDHCREYLAAMDMLAGLRLCANVPGQWAVQTALGGNQSIHDLVSPGGRLHETRQCVIDEVARSPYFDLVTPQGAMYAFIRVRTETLPAFDDEAFAMDLLMKKHVLVAPGVSFNVPYKDHFRITLLPEHRTMREVFARMHDLLDEYREAAS